MSEKSFYEKIYDVVRRIPEGKICTYGSIAEYLGSKGSARMVGWAMNQAHQQEEYVPAHRVVNRFGLLSGKHHFGGPNIMQSLLEQEGIKIKDDVVQDFEKKLWIPE